MILPDSSVWIDHLRIADPVLARLLGSQLVRTHPFIVGELAAGTLARRAQVLSSLNDLPGLPQAEHNEVMVLLDRHHLAGRGLGWIDLHLLTACRISGASLWSHDKRLAKIAHELKINFDPAGL